MNSDRNSKTPSSAGQSPNKKEETTRLNNSETNRNVNSRWKLEYKRDNLHQTTITNSKSLLYSKQVSISLVCPKEKQRWTNFSFIRNSLSYRFYSK